MPKTFEEYNKMVTDARVYHYRRLDESSQNLTKNIDLAIRRAGSLDGVRDEVSRLLNTHKEYRNTLWNDFNKQVDRIHGDYAKNTPQE